MMEYEVDVVGERPTTVDQATYLLTKTNISFYLKKVQLFKRNTSFNQEEIASVIKNSIDHFNAKMNSLKEVGIKSFLSSLIASEIFSYLVL